MLQEHKLVSEMKLVIALIVALATVLPAQAKDDTISTAFSVVIMTNGIIRKDLPLPTYLQDNSGKFMLIQYGKYVGKENLYLCWFKEPEPSDKYNILLPHCIGPPKLNK